MEQIAYNPKTDDRIDTVTKIMNAARAVDGKSRVRILHRSDAADLLNLIERFPEARTTRSYSVDGFVPNSYKYPSYITRATGERQSDGTWVISVDRGTASRSNGKGALLTVDNRGVDL